MVMAGEMVMNEARRWGARIIPVDSEHSALFQGLEGRKKEEIESIILTCSGGPFYHWPQKKLSKVTPALALRHPTWTMGRKITIDSATLMNKGLEIIEATYLFGMNLSRVKVLIHPQAMVHGLIQFIDGVLLGLLGQPDMRLAIQYALHYPDRQKNAFPRLDLGKVGALHFYPPDEKKFPSLALAREARQSGGTMPAVLNAANEVAVEVFLKGKLEFLKIVAVVRKVMERHRVISHPDLNKILEADRWAREEARKVIYNK
jgi:1-deoxy-D-xylulose-5-phosphate reductoisomerase